MGKYRKKIVSGNPSKRITFSSHGNIIVSYYLMPREQWWIDFLLFMYVGVGARSNFQPELGRPCLYVGCRCSRCRNVVKLNVACYFIDLTFVCRVSLKQCSGSLKVWSSHNQLSTRQDIIKPQTLRASSEINHNFELSRVSLTCCLIFCIGLQITTWNFHQHHRCQLFSAFTSLPGSRLVRNTHLISEG